jgi:hypothetical protein
LVGTELFDFRRKESPTDYVVMSKKAHAVFENRGKGIPFTEHDIGRLEWAIREAMGFWRRNVDCNKEDLEPFEREQMRKIKHVTLDLNRSVTTKEARRTVKEMQDQMKWWRLKGAKFNPKKSSKAEKEKYAKLQALTVLFPSNKIETT